MQQNWIIDVLTDLRAFAAANEMPGLAEQLDDARMVALAEISTKEGQPARGRTEQRVFAQPDNGAFGTG